QTDAGDSSSHEPEVVKPALSCLTFVDNRTLSFCVREFFPAVPAFLITGGFTVRTDGNRATRSRSRPQVRRRGRWAEGGHDRRLFPRGAGPGRLPLLGTRPVHRGAVSRGRLDRRAVHQLSPLGFRGGGERGRRCGRP